MLLLGHAGLDYRHGLMENRHGLLVGACVIWQTGTPSG